MVSKTRAEFGQQKQQKQQQQQQQKQQQTIVTWTAEKLTGYKAIILPTSRYSIECCHGI